MTFCHESLGAKRFLHPDGLTLVTNAALRRPPSIAQRHQYDYAFHCPELRSVESTAAANDYSGLHEGDATDVSFITGELTAVGTPLRVDGTIPEPNKGGVSTHPR
jgi:hypothetical protein